MIEAQGLFQKESSHMSDDLNKKIMQIADMLGQEGMPENIKGLLSLLSSSGSSEEAPPRQNDIAVKKEDKHTKSDFDDSFEMMRKVKGMMDRVNPSSDPRLNLITAIKPFLNSKRQQKLSNCMMLLQMSRLSRLMDNNEKKD